MKKDVVESVSRSGRADSGRANSGRANPGRARGWTEKFIMRSTTGFIYAALVVVSLYLGSYTTAFLVSGMSWLCCSEFFHLVRMSGRMPNEFIGLSAALFFPLAALIRPIFLLFCLFSLIIIAGAWFIATPRASVADIAATIFGPVYTGLMLSSIVLIRVSHAPETGAFLTFGVMSSIWSNDAFAYLIGSRLGKHPLAPRISPKKSVEGLIGGVVSAVAVWIILAILVAQGILMVNLPLPLALCGGFATGIAGVVGDLVESRIKRGVGVKDSGILMPGHGGLLDRCDSLIFGSMMAYFILLFGGVL